MKNKIGILILSVFMFATPLININAQAQNSNCYSNSTKPCFSSISVSRNDKEATIWFSTVDKNIDEFMISVTLFQSDNTHFTGNTVSVKKSDIVSGITPSIKLGKNYGNTPDLDLSPNTFYLAKIVLIWTIDTGGTKNIYSDNYFASFKTRQTGETILLEDNSATIDYGSNTERCEEYYNDPNKPADTQTNPITPIKKWWYNTKQQNFGFPQWKGPFSSKDDCQKIDKTLLLSPNTSGTQSGDWWYKQTKDDAPKGPFSSVAECEKERAKGNSYSKQCFQFYYPLAPLPGQADKIDTTTSGDSDCPFGNYLNILIKLFIGICAVLAMIKIVLGGMQYMTSELSSGKEDGKNSITSAVFGLILALGAFAILNTINPELLKVCLNNLPKAVVMVENEPETGIDSDSTGKATINLIKKSDNSIVSLTNCDTTQMVTVNAFGTSMQVYKGLKPSLERINQQWLAHPASDRYKIKTVYAYNCRKVRNKPNAWSSHAFGLALDINPQENPYGNTLKTDMPSWFKQLFINEGWGWGGDWVNVKDAMHFSKYPSSENGDKKIEI